jgi:hypothetical protein
LAAVLAGGRFLALGHCRCDRISCSGRHDFCLFVSKTAKNWQTKITSKMEPPSERCITKEAKTDGSE